MNDSKGNEIRIGDKVLIEARIVELCGPAGTSKNLRVQTITSIGAANATMFTINNNQVTRHAEPPRATPTRK
jgi:hypothetical protein